MRPGRKPNCGLLLGLVESSVWISLMQPSLSMIRFVLDEDGGCSDDDVVALPAAALPAVFSAQVEASTLQ